MTSLVTDLLNQYGYDILELIGHGGYAECYKIYSRQYKQFFACKVMMLPDKKKVERQLSFQNELDALTSIIHPYIIHVYDTIVTDSVVILILEYCPNGNLYQEIMRNGVYRDTRKLFAHLQMLLSAFEYLEERKMVHNDIKPANVLIDQYGRLKLADFGLTQTFENVNDFSEDYRGSLAYVSPEILSRRPFNPFKANIWSFGVMLYFLVVGKTPFPTDNLASFQEKILRGSYDLPTKIDRTVAKIIKSCLIIDPAKRISFRDIKKMIDDASIEKAPATLPRIPNLHLAHPPVHAGSLTFQKLNRKVGRIVRPKSIVF